MPRREALSAGLLQATSLSFVVAATQIGVEIGKLEPAAAAGLVTGGVISVLSFPALALRLAEAGVIDGVARRPGRPGLPAPGAPDAGDVVRGPHPAGLLRDRLPGDGRCSSRGCGCAPATRSTSALAKRWSKAMLILFAIGVVTGTILSFEMGLLWPEFMATFGDVFGLAFAIEGFSFFIEAIFIAIYVYGWDRLLAARALRWPASRWCSPASPAR